jgi:hypothetical protein
MASLVVFTGTSGAALTKLVELWGFKCSICGLKAAEIMCGKIPAAAVHFHCSSSANKIEVHVSKFLRLRLAKPALPCSSPVVNQLISLMFNSVDHLSILADFGLDGKGCAPPYVVPRA